jgi:hypothetical protein
MREVGCYFEAREKRDATIAVVESERALKGFQPRQTERKVDRGKAYS